MSLRTHVLTFNERFFAYSTNIHSYIYVQYVIHYVVMYN